MNWAHRLILHTPNIEPVIAAPIIVKNEFYEPHFEYIFSLYQIQFPKNEWSVSNFQKGLNYLTVKYLEWYQHFLLKEIKKRKIDLIHVHFGNVAANFMPILEKSGLPFVVTFHGYDYEMIPFTRPKYQKLYVRIFENAALITCGGDFSSQSIRAKSPNPERVKTLKLGVDGKNLPFWKREKKERHLKILQASTFSDKKGHIFTIRAFQKALKICPNMELHFIGEAQNRGIKNEIENFIKIHQIQKKVKFLDLLPYQQFYKKLKNYHVFMQPSVWSKTKDRESAPIVLLDAQATGMPIISTFHADIPEEVLHEKTGLLAQEKNTEILAKHIERFYKMGQKEFDKFANNARNHVVKNYAVTESGVQLFSLYKSILSNF